MGGMSGARELLVRVRALLADPKRWTTKAYARGASGSPLQSGADEKAVAWCLQGALQHERGPSWMNGVGRDWTYLRDALESLYRHMPSDRASLPLFNDKATHAEVLALLDRAIEPA